MKHLPACVVVVVLLAASASGQQTRDATPGRATTGTSTIRGVVMSMDSSPQPVRRAVVTIAGDLERDRSVITDDEGRFSFSELPAGRFTVTARKPAYLNSAYGAIRPGRTGTAIALAAGQSLDITVPMARGAAITGTIRDRHGRPLAGLRVSIASVIDPATLDRALASALSVMTDDRGVYRAYGLEPGEYVVAAVHEATGLGAIGQRSTAEVDRLFAELALRGSQPVRMNPPPATPGASAPAPTLPTPASYAMAPTFYPGTPLMRDATRIKVAAGEEREGIDFQALPVRVGLISGTVSGDVGNLTAVKLGMSIEGVRSPSQLGAAPVLSHPPDAEGRFEFSNVGPGRYTIVARATRGASAPPASPTGLSGRGGSAPVATPGDYVFASVDVDAHGEDVTGLALVLQPGARLRGRIQFDASTASVPDDFTGIRVGIMPPGGTYVSTRGSTTFTNTFTGAPPVQVNDDGTFEIVSIGPGRVALSCTLPAELRNTWWLRSAIAGGRDLLDGPVDVTLGGPMPEVVVTLSDRRTELSGRLESPQGAPAPEYFVIAFPADRTLWHPGSRRVEAVRPATDGRFIVSNLPPGDYLVAALVDVGPNEWNNPAFLGEIAPAGVRITLGEGEKRTLDLRVR